MIHVLLSLLIIEEWKDYENIYTSSFSLLKYVISCKDTTNLPNDKTIDGKNVEDASQGEKKQMCTIKKHKQFSQTIYHSITFPRNPLNECSLQSDRFSDRMIDFIAKH